MISAAQTDTEKQLEVRLVHTCASPLHPHVMTPSCAALTCLHARSSAATVFSLWSCNHTLKEKNKSSRSGFFAPCSVCFCLSGSQHAPSSTICCISLLKCSFPNLSLHLIFSASHALSPSSPVSFSPLPLCFCHFPPSSPQRKKKSPDTNKF